MKKINKEKLQFRRQFLIGKTPFQPNQYWNNHKLTNNHYLSHHIDLPFYTKSVNDITISILGIILNPLSPTDDEKIILESLLNNATDLKSLFNSTLHLSGRWIIIFQNHKDTFLFTDPCGFRQIFYLKDKTDFACGSQPEIIKACNLFDIKIDPLLNAITKNKDYINTEGMWVGSKTIYSNVYHLMPNHFLDLKNQSQSRFTFQPRRQVSEEEIIKNVSTLLQGTIAAITYRYNAKLALTAGWDSRVLLAASKKEVSKLAYFTDRKGVISIEHADVWVPRLLTKKLHLKYKVINSHKKIPSSIIDLLSQNITDSRILPKTRMIYYNLIKNDFRVNINGNGSEICRNYFDKYSTLSESELTPKVLIGLLGYKNTNPFFENEINIWLQNLPSLEKENFGILNLLYWEHKLGNWGAKYPSEQDISNEEISPFNCRLIIELLLSCKPNSRIAPNYLIYKKLINHMWPETLNVPINPGTKPNVASQLKRKIKLTLSYTSTRIFNLNREF
ncbi:hypothetical protein [Mangrovimonas sp. TPBH4]|uniref:hypothetical protein n=1 Tax=Mangrovimonas sp. TPBH4 TaxID=1645914 RepID=UPI0006B5E938|nr:hypothetical protein [Mangrovimonas sp. TPBH4]